MFRGSERFMRGRLALGKNGSKDDGERKYNLAIAENDEEI